MYHDKIQCSPFDLIEMMTNIMISSVPAKSVVDFVVYDIY